MFIILAKDVNEYKNGKFPAMAARGCSAGTATAGVLMPRHPKVGDKFMSETVPKIHLGKGRGDFRFRSRHRAAGTFSNCLKIKEIASDATRYKLSTGVAV